MEEIKNKEELENKSISSFETEEWDEDECCCNGDECDCEDCNCDDEDEECCGGCANCSGGCCGE